jgi:hypothetical protein
MLPEDTRDAELASPTRPLLIILALALIAATWAAPSLSDSNAMPCTGAARAVPECRFEPLSIKSGWISSAAYVPALHRILLVDSSLNRLLLVSPNGEAAKVEGVLAERAALPALIAPTAGGFLLKLIGPTILSLDPALKLLAMSDLKRAAGSSTVSSVYQWTPVGSSVLAYGSVRSPSFVEGYKLGLLRFPAAAGVLSRPKLLLPFANSTFYMLGYQYLASIGSTGYFLAMDKQATLYKVPAGRSPVALLNAVPTRFRALPSLKTKMTGPVNGPALFRELEGATMPAGLYGGADGFLYLLTRQPGRPMGTTDWTIYRFDAEDKRFVGHGRLRTSAKHLTAVPGPDAWYFFERGDVALTGRQTLGSMIVVPNARLTSIGNAGGEICPAGER